MSDKDHKRVHRTDTKDDHEYTPVAARYTTTTAGSYATSPAVTIIDYDTKVYDTHNAVTTGAAWKFTSPMTRYYNIAARALIATTGDWAETESAHLIVYVDGVSYAVLDTDTHIYDNGSNVLAVVNGSTDIYLAVGSYVDVRLSQESGGTRALNTSAGHNWISIHSIL